MNLAGFSVDHLATQCAEETEKYSRRQPSVSQYCFELFRRALAERIQEAITWIYQIYERELHGWVYRHSRFDETGETADYFANEAFEKFFFAVGGPKFEGFDSVGALLKYLKLCVHTAIVQYLRDQRRIDPLSIDDPDRPVIDRDPGQEDDLDKAIEASEVWAAFCRLLPAPSDRLLARCVFLLEMKPSEIIAAKPGRWSSEREISVALYRIRRLVRQDPEVRELFNLPAPEPAE